MDLTLLYNSDDLSSNISATVSTDNECMEDTILYDYESALEMSSEGAVGSSNNFSITIEAASDILHIIGLQKPTKWNDFDEAKLMTSFKKLSFLKSMTRTELLEICRYKNLKLIGIQSELKVVNVTRVDLINQLSSLLGLGETLEKPLRSKKTCSPKTLQDLASDALIKKSYPKQVLNIAYGSFIWTDKVKEWRNDSQISDKVDVVGLKDCSFEPYYLPEFDNELDTFKLYVYDKTHLATNFRKSVCLDRVEGVSVDAWKSVAKKRPDILHPSIVDVSDGKILDQMKEKLSRNMFSKDVESQMIELEYEKEAEACEVIREALFVADDTPGISAKNRCQKSLALIRWLDNGVDFGSFPPYGAYIKGLSNVLYEGLRTSQEAKLYLHAVAKGGTYCVRAPNTLCSESFFSSMQESDPWGQGILTTSGVEKHVTDIATITAMKMEKTRNIFIKTKRDTAYPTPEVYVDSHSSGCDDVPECRCRQDKFIRCIVPRDHFFDTEARARNRKEDRPFKIEGTSGELKGEEPIRRQFGYKVNATKMLPSKRLGIDLNSDN